MAINQYVVFELNGIEFGLNIAKINDIIRPLEYFKVPNTPDYICGMINLRGDVYVIIDLRLRMHLPHIDEGEETKVIIVNNNGMTAGFTIDRVNRMHKFETDNLKEVPKTLENLDKNFVEGVIEDKDGLIYQLNLDVIMAMKDDAPSA